MRLATAAFAALLIVAALASRNGETEQTTSLSRALLDDGPPKGKGCPNSMRSCSSRCVDLSKDAAHCGKCNNACRKGYLCSEAYCKCPEGNYICQNAECVSRWQDCPASQVQCSCPPPPVPVYQCTCRTPLPVTALNSSNSCDNSRDCGATRGTLCYSGGPGLEPCDCYTAAQNPCGPIAYCSFQQTDDPQGGHLCYQTCCDRNGTVNIQGQSISACTASGVATCAAARCGGTDDLYLYNISSGVFDLLLDNVKVVDFTAKCTQGECFVLCEKNGVILTDTIKSYMIMTFLGDKECPAGYTQDGTCTLASCDGAPGGV